MKVREALDRGAQCIALGLGLDRDTAWLEARVLFGHVAGRDRAWIAGHADDILDEESAFEQAVARRERGEPVAYIVGEREFFGHRIRVTPDVLIPRPETELIVDLALKQTSMDAQSRILDLGTGSGAIAIAIALARPRSLVVAVDSSRPALDLARDNAIRLGASNIRFVAGDWSSCPAIEAGYDFIVANPPYVPDGDPHLGQGDLRFEPRRALAGGFDGLDAIRAIARAAPGLLHPGGTLLLEHGWDQGAAAASLLIAAGFRDVSCHRDLGGRDRVARCRFS